MPKISKERPKYLLAEFDKPLYLAAHFGFLPIECPKITEKDIELTKDCLYTGEEKRARAVHDAAEKAAFLRTYLEKEFNALPHPLSICYKRQSDYSLHIVGFSSALAEAILIRTAISLLTEEGYRNVVVDINSIGDKDSLASYERELHHYAKKISGDIPPESKKLLKEDIFELLKLTLPDPIRDHIPPSIASLSAPSRAHFKEMLEYLEALGVEFRLAHTLIGNKHYASQTIFAIRNSEDNALLAEGCRYSRLTKRLGFKKEMPAASVNITSILKKDAKRYTDLPKAKFYLVQLSRDAKMKALPLLELLRINKIPVYHFLGRDKITAQLGAAESMRVPYLLIVGQKEAIDNTVTIRNMSTRAQDTIPMAVLPEYLKSIAL